MGLKLGALFLKVSIFLAKRVFKLLQCLSLLLVFLFPQVFLAVHTVDLGLRIIIDLLADRLEPLIVDSLDLFLLPGEVLILAIQELDLLLQKGLLTARVEVQLHILFLLFAELQLFAL